jgi:hypothetical protein
VINGALISGKIAAISIISKQKGLNEFNKFSSKLNKDLLLHTVYWHLPFKNLMRNQIMNYQDKLMLPINRSIPGFINEDWLKIKETED